MPAQLKKYLPFLTWLPNYDRANLKGDMLAGLTTAVMLIPQAMAYAMLAGLPPIHGLYASIVPLAVYALLGTSRQLAVGPAAMVSLLVATGVSTVAEPGTAMFVTYAIVLALMVGLVQTAMGIARLGFLVNFLSHPVVAGFSSAAALIIGFGQLKHLLGLSIPRSGHIHTILIETIEKASQINPTTLLIGASAIVVLVVAKRYWPQFPRALAVVVLGTGAVFLFGLDVEGVAVVGAVPAGLPSPEMPAINLELVRALMPTAVTIALVGFVQSISVAKTFANKNKYDVDANQELIGLGMANVAGAFFQAYPVTGGFSRTAVNASVGAKTSLASLVTAGVVAVALMFFTPMFYFLPKSVLAAIIMVAVFGLVDVAEVKHLWQVKRGDLALMGLTFGATLTLGIERGILIGVGASLLWFVVRTTQPHIAILGRVPGTTAYRNIADHTEAEVVPSVLVVRMDAQFYFGNVMFLKDTLRRLEAEQSEPLRAVVIDASAMNQLDSSAATALRELLLSYRERGIELVLSNVKRPVRIVLERAGFVDVIGADRIFFTTHCAILWTYELPRVDGTSTTPSPSMTQEEAATPMLGALSARASS